MGPSLYDELLLQVLQPLQKAKPLCLFCTKQINNTYTNPIENTKKQKLWIAFKINKIIPAIALGSPIVFQSLVPIRTEAVVYILPKINLVGVSWLIVFKTLYISFAKQYFSVWQAENIVFFNVVFNMLNWKTPLCSNWKVKKTLRSLKIMIFISDVDDAQNILVFLKSEIFYYIAVLNQTSLNNVFGGIITLPLLNRFLKKIVVNIMRSIWIEIRL